MNERLFKSIAQILKEASGPSEEHERLRGDLDSWARANGYSKQFDSLGTSSRPDVVRGSGDDILLFVGDAKDVASERPGNSATIRRILRYFREFAEILSSSEFRGGQLAIATNDAQAANDWVPILNYLAIAVGLTSSPGGDPPDFQVEQLPGKETWIVRW